MSQAELPSLVEIEEKGEESFDCPPGIEQQLKLAAFDQRSATEFVKRRTSLITGKERDVVRVYIEDGTLRVEVEDIVGLVDLTPESRIRIEPKIGWRDILEMYLAVYEADRSIEHHGIPIDDFLSNDIGLEDIFVIIAINWCNSLTPLYRYGFMREFETKRYNSVSGRGRIDIERSLQNFERGIPKQHYVQKITNYSIPENEIIHKAGDVLHRLFQQEASSNQLHRYFNIFSEVKAEIDKLEQQGINSSKSHSVDYRSVSPGTLPRQRSYYQDAVKISKMILSSTSGRSLASGAEELTVDYIIDMGNLFENFTQVVLEEETRKILDYPLYSTDATIEIEDKPSLQPFSDSTRSSYQPDHVLRVNNEAVAVLDSKYYSADNDPSSFSRSRTTMFAYAFLLNVEKMAFLCPSGTPRIRSIEGRSGEVEVITPNKPFTPDRYRHQIRSYLQKLLDSYLEESKIVSDLLTYDVAYDEMVPETVEKLIKCETLRPSYSGLFARKILVGAATHSTAVRAIRSVPKNQKARLQNMFKNIINQNNDYDIYIPLFVPSGEYREMTPENIGEKWDGESIQLYGIKITENIDVNNIDNIGIFPLDWKGEL